jgi:hypothetical protein
MRLPRRSLGEGGREQLRVKFLLKFKIKSRQ